MADEADNRPVIYVGDQLLKKQGAKTRAEADAMYESIIAMTIAQSPGTTKDDFLFVRGTASIWPENLAERAAAAEAEPVGAPGAAQADLDDPTPYPPRPAITSTGMKSAPDHASDAQALQHGVYTASPDADVAHEPVQVQVPVQVPVPIGHRAALPASLEDIQASRAAAQHLGLRLPADAHGVCFADIQSRAAAMRCNATLVYGGEVLLESAFGRWYCKSFAEACQRLNGTL